MTAIKAKLLNLIDAGNEVTGNEDTNITDVIQALIDGYGTGSSSIKYAHYMGHISPMNGYYNSHSYDAVFIKNGYLYVFYTQAPSHFTDKTDSSTSLMLCKYNISTKSVVSCSLILNPARCFWHGVEVNGTYYLFAESGTKYRLATTDFENFTEASWTAPGNFSNMNYLCVGANNRLICDTGRTETGCYIYYSDDLGLTWTKATGYSNAITTHGGFVHLGNGKIVLYCQDSYSGNMDSTTSTHATKRVVMVSEDNGETWTGSLCQNADLLDCGITYNSGSFCKVGDYWYFGTSKRIVEAQENGKYTLGDIRLFKGTEQDVINGTMSLFKTVDNFDTGSTSIMVSSIAIQSDSGNMCMRTDGTNLYLVYHRPLLHQDTTRYGESTSMICLAIADATRGGSVADDYYNSNWESERDAFASAQDTSYDLYAYGQERNIGYGLYDNTDYVKIPTTDTVPKTTLVIPFTSEFEVITVFCTANRQINSVWADQYVGANINGNVHVFGGTGNYLLNRPNDSNGGTCVLGDSTLRYHLFKLSLENGVVTATVNGRTIPNLQCPATISTRNIASGTIVLTLGDMESYLPTYTAAGMIYGFKAIAINTDGDISSILGYKVTYTGTNCTFSNTSTVVSGSYSCTVTPDTGYELNSLSYTMGGTTYSVTGDTINISNVTGRLNIIAEIVAEHIELVTDGLISWYDLGDETTIDSTGLITSKVSNNDIAWTGNPAMSARISQRSKPTVFYSGYASTYGAVQFILNSTLANINSTVTLEYIICANETGFYGHLVAGIKTNGSSSVNKTWGFEYQSGTGLSMRIFSHVVFILDSTGIVSGYVNGTLKFSNKSLNNCMTVNTFGIGDSSNATVRLGHVRLYNKALSTSEINQNYRYFVQNCKVGQTAYDSSGNFVG